jgi:hypothetical protein
MPLAPRTRFHVSSLALISAAATILLALSGCPTPGGPSQTTGEISGNARFTGQSDNSGILISAEAVDSSGKTLAVKQALSKGTLGAKTVAAQATTDTSGSYSLTGLTAGTYTVYASSQNSLEKAVTTDITVEAGKSVTAADLSLTPTGTVSGVATLNGGASGNLGIVVFLAGTSYSAMTNSLGAYTISSVPAATGYTLVASKQGYDSQTTSVDVTAGSTATVAKMNLTLSVTPPSTGSVTGTAQLNGATSGNTGIFVYLAGTPYITMTTASSGSFTIAGVAPGTYTAAASMVGYTTISIGSVVVTAGSAASVGTMNLVSTVVVAEPAFTVTGSGLMRTVKISCATAGAAIYYTTDGSTPTTGSTPYSAPISFGGEVGISEPISAIGVASGMTSSPQASTTVSIGSISALSLGAIVSTLAGSTTGGHADGTGAAASFNLPYGITTDGTNLYVSDFNNNEIRRIVIASGVVTTLAGSSFNAPGGITTDGANLYVSDTNNNEIRKIVIASGVVTTLAGSTTPGHADGTGAAATFTGPIGITTDGTNLYVSDTSNNEIRKIVIASGVVTTLAGSTTPGHADGTGAAASFNAPGGITTDGTNLYVSDSTNNEIRKIVIASGVVTTPAGSTTGGHADGTGAAASFTGPGAIMTDGTNLYVADTFNNEIRNIR